MIAYLTCENEAGILIIVKNRFGLETISRFGVEKQTCHTQEMQFFLNIKYLSK
jgi:hypothetical protein